MKRENINPFSKSERVAGLGIRGNGECFVFVLYFGLFFLFFGIFYQIYCKIIVL